MENKRTDNIISTFAILIIIAILAYIFYAILKSNNLFNSNELLNDISQSSSESIELSKEVTPIEKEIVYTET